MLIACLYQADMLLKNDAGWDEGFIDQLSSRLAGNDKCIFAFVLYFDPTVAAQEFVQIVCGRKLHGVSVLVYGNDESSNFTSNLTSQIR